ncbi:hypothetical protein B0H15DRAFT_865007 [Mycena belliarum]|uniref:Uncharacterized protein n=1 Tax=Mycena belliarum TaxID=1033014 RepID=A0AAD6XK39_9AGAR|nr:hypothetical protein B0H15DRAFT_865007 [Mycena belliae]
MARESVADNVDSKCRIAEITQHSCVPKKNRFGHPVVHCIPIPRLFRMCPDQPAVEVTRVVEIDLATGSVEMPKALGQMIPQGKAWRDVVKIDTGNEEE